MGFVCWRVFKINVIISGLFVKFRLNDKLFGKVKVSIFRSKFSVMFELKESRLMWFSVLQLLLKRCLRLLKFLCWVIISIWLLSFSMVLLLVSKFILLCWMCVMIVENCLVRFSEVIFLFVIFGFDIKSWCILKVVWLQESFFL